MIEDILAKAGSGALLERQDALRLLEVATGSAEYYALLGAANAYARTAFRGRGVIFAQIEMCIRDRPGSWVEPRRLSWAASKICLAALAGCCAMVQKRAVRIKRLWLCLLYTSRCV